MSDAEYELTFRFPDQSPSYTHGFECGTINGRMLAGESFEAIIHATNRQTIQDLAEMRGYAVTFSFLNDDWLQLSAEKAHA